MTSARKHRIVNPARFPCDLQIIRLRSGDRLIRPACCLGTTGFYPKPWEVAVFNGPSAQESFLAANPNWRPEELGEVVGCLR